ncbi:fimbria/pilus outer membrane usher protein [Salmonella enterica subsp. enterica]|nr:fimbria/pilus outer membrane usher protein [Salmonella enterica subsp. enterica]
MTVGGAHHSPIFYLPQTYLFRALPALRSKTDAPDVPASSLFLTPSALPGSLWPAMRRMLPPSLQGYAPKISGIAVPVMHRLPSARMAAFCTGPGVAGAAPSFPT